MSRRALITIIAFMYRYLFTLREEADRLIRARAARSASSQWALVRRESGLAGENRRGDGR